jgi:hypothetical protein
MGMIAYYRKMTDGLLTTSILKNCNRSGTRMGRGLRISKSFSKKRKNVFGKPLGQWIEAKITRFQKKRVAHRYAELSDKSGTVISDRMLKFHNEDKRAYYQAAWAKRIASF